MMEMNKMDKVGPIKVMIVDDHSMVRRGLTAFLKNEPDLEIIGEARDGREAIQNCERIQPDVILMDLIMPDLGGVATTRMILQRWPEIRVLALTSFQEKELVQEALQAGATGYLLKNVSGEELADAIRATHAGKPTLAREAVESLIQAETSSPSPGNDLTRRELEVLSLLVKGLSNPEIAGKLSVSRSTVKSHVSSILSKLGVSNRAAAIALAIEHKILP
jgi:NarL family two-component system response regulator LiaR